MGNTETKNKHILGIYIRLQITAMSILFREKKDFNILGPVPLSSPYIDKPDGVGPVDNRPSTN